MRPAKSVEEIKRREEVLHNISDIREKIVKKDIPVVVAALGAVAGAGILTYFLLKLIRK